MQVKLAAREGWAAAQGSQCVVVLATELTDELIGEGIAKDLIRTIQSLRKEIQCDYTDRIEVGIVPKSNEVERAIEQNESLIAGETLAISITKHCSRRWWQSRDRRCHGDDSSPSLGFVLAQHLL